MSSIDAVARAVSTLDDQVVDGTYKGIPWGKRVTITDIATQGWNVRHGDLALPILTVTESALANNLAVMRDY